MLKKIRKYMVLVPVLTILSGACTMQYCKWGKMIAEQKLGKEQMIMTASTSSGSWGLGFGETGTETKPTGTPKTLLWAGAGQESEGSWIQPFYGYGVLFFGGICLAVLLWIVSCRTKDWKQELLIRFAIAGFSVAISVLLVTGGRLVIGEAWSYEWKDPLAVESVLVTLSLLFWHRLYRLNKQDKGL